MSMRNCPLRGAPSRHHDQHSPASAPPLMRWQGPRRQRSVSALARKTTESTDRLSGRCPGSRHAAARTSGATAVVTRALPAGDSGRGGIDSNSGFSSSTASTSTALTSLPPLPPLPSNTLGQGRTPPVFLQPLLAAVVAVTAGRLRSLPPALLAWLLCILSSLGYCPTPAWLAEAYCSLTAGLDELQPNQAAQAFLAVASLAATEHPAPAGSCETLAPPPPPPELLLGLYNILRRPDGPGGLDPPVALACLEAAAAAEFLSASPAPQGLPARGAWTSPTWPPAQQSQAGLGVSGKRPGPGPGDHSGIRLTAGAAVAAAGSSSSSSSSSGQVMDGSNGGDVASRGGGQLRRPQQQQRMGTILNPCMPEATVEVLMWRAAGLRPSPVGASAAVAAAPGATSPSAAVAAARALVAAARLPNPPGPAAVGELAVLVAEHSGGDGGAFGGDGGGGGGSPGLLADSLTALRALRAPPLPLASAAALLSGLEDQLQQLNAVQLSYCVAALQTLAAEPPAVAAAALQFARGPAAAELARQLPGLPAPRLAVALTALPPPLRPLPAELAAAAHAALAGCVAAADSDDLAEVLRQLGDADALPGYGWQGALAAEAGRRMPDAAAAAMLSSQELCNTLFLLAALNYRPSFSWTASAASALQPRLLTLTTSQLTNALWGLAKFGHQAEPPWSTSAVQAVQLQLPSLRPHQLSYGLGSLQRMRCLVNSVVLDEMLTAAAQQLPQYPPPDLVLLLMTVARLRHVPSYSFTEAVTERLRPHVVAVAAAVEPAEAALRAAAAAAGAASTVDLRLSLAAAGSDGGAVRGAAVDVDAMVAAAVTPLTCQELASVGYALAKLHSRPEADWLSSYMEACLAVMEDFSPDLLASLLWAVGELGQAPSPAWLAGFLDATRPRLAEFAPQDLVSVLSSLAALRSPPPAGWLGDALTVLGARVGGLDGVGVAALLKALVDLDARVSNPQWYEALCDQVSAFLPMLPPQGLIDLVASLGMLGHKPGEEWLKRCCSAAARVQAQAAQQAATAARAAAAAASRADGGGSRGGGGVGLTGAGAGGLSVQQLEALVCGLARLGAEPPQQLLQAFYAGSTAALAQMSPERVTALASALAGAKVAPEPEWLDALAGAVRNGVMSYTLVQLDALTRALAVFQGLVPEHGATRDLLAFLREFCLYG